MIKTTKVDLTIRDNVTGSYLRIPVLPETIQYRDGEAMKDTVQILNLGNVNFHNGVDMDEFTVESFFPASYDVSYCTTSDLLSTERYRNTFSSWKDSGTSLQIVCPAAYLNKNMELASFDWYFSGPEMDLYYTATFKERRVIKPIKVAVKSAGDGTLTLAAPKPGLESRSPVPKKAKPSTVTVKSGDCLITIAKRLPPTVSWSQLYTANKKLIGSDPGFILPGMVLKVPA